MANEQDRNAHGRLSLSDRRAALRAIASGLLNESLRVETMTPQAKAQVRAALDAVLLLASKTLTMG